MKSYKINLEFSNPYIGSRNGGNREITEFVELEKAIEWLRNKWNEVCDEGYAETWEEAVEMSDNGIDCCYGFGENAKVYYDSRVWSIEVVEDEE